MTAELIFLRYDNVNNLFDVVYASGVLQLQGNSCSKPDMFNMLVIVGDVYASGTSQEFADNGLNVNLAPVSSFKSIASMRLAKLSADVYYRSNILVIPHKKYVSDNCYAKMCYIIVMIDNQIRWLYRITWNGLSTVLGLNIENPQEFANAAAVFLCTKVKYYLNMTTRLVPFDEMITRCFPEMIRTEPGIVMKKISIGEMICKRIQTL